MKTLRSLLVSALVFGLSAFSAFAQPGDGAEVFYNKGEAFLKQGNAASALDEYNSALTLRPEEPQFHFKKAICYLLLKDTAQAVKSFDQTTDLDADFVPAYQQKAQIFYKTGEILEFVKNLNELSRLIRPQDEKKALEFKLNCAQALMGIQEWGKAYKYTKEALEIDGQNAQALLLNSQMANKNKDYQAAIGSAEFGISQTPPNQKSKLALYYFEKGYAHHFLGQYKEKEEAFKFAAPVPQLKARIDQLSPQYYYGLSQAYLNVYHPEKASSMLDEAKKIRKDYSEAYILSGEIARNKQFSPEEVKEYREAISAVTSIPNPEPKSVLLLYQKLIGTLLKAEQYGDAIKACDAALARFPSAHDLMFKKAMAVSFSGKVKDGITILTKIVADESNIKPKDLSRYFLALGLLYDKDGNDQSAKDAFRNSISKMGKSNFAVVSAYELGQ